MNKQLLKKTIQNSTPVSMKKFFTRVGAFFQAGDPFLFPSQEAAYLTLKRLGWTPRGCIDVGAYHGDWAKMFLEIFPDSQTLMVEALDSKREGLINLCNSKPDRLSCEMALLGPTNGEEVHFVEMETGSSVFEEASPYPRNKTRKTTITLDALTQGTAFERATAIKVDTQGYELEILKGADRLLSTAECVLLEVSLLQINRGAPSFAEVVEFMGKRDFKVFDFCSQIRRKDGVLWQTDLMFIKDGAIPAIRAELSRDNW